MRIIHIHAPIQKATHAHYQVRVARKTSQQERVEWAVEIISLQNAMYIGVEVYVYTSLAYKIRI